MTEDKTTITDNEVLAKFENLPPQYEDGTPGFVHEDEDGFTWGYAPEELQYHKKWSWLMPVVEKIESLGYQVEICNQMCVIYNSMDVPIVIQGMPGMSKLQAAHKSVLEWIRWYNTQSKP